MTQWCFKNYCRRWKILESKDNEFPTEKKMKCVAHFVTKYWNVKNKNKYLTWVHNLIKTHFRGGTLVNTL